MSKKQAFKELRREFERFPNLELTETIELGKIGYYDNRKAKFRWRTTLSKLGINVPTHATPASPLVDELYTTRGAVDYMFSLDANQYANAKFNFSKNYSLATQATGLIESNYEIQNLENNILNAIKNSGLEWEQKWVVVTKVFQAPSFTLMISGSKNSEISLSTSVPVNIGSFNIANNNLKLAIKSSRKMAYRVIAKQNVTPFFQIYKLKGNWNNQDLKLEPYGRG